MCFQIYVHVGEFVSSWQRTGGTAANSSSAGQFHVCISVLKSLGSWSSRIAYHPHHLRQMSPRRTATYAVIQFNVSLQRTELEKKDRELAALQPKISHQVQELLEQQRTIENLNNQLFSQEKERTNQSNCLFLEV